MQKKIFSLLAVVGCAALAQPAARAQTGRIAHFSHGGSRAVWRAANAGPDNFGMPPALFEVDSVQVLSEAEVIEYGTLTPYRQKSRKSVRDFCWLHDYKVTTYLYREKGQHPAVKVSGIVVDSVRVLSETAVVEYARLKDCAGVAVGKQFWYKPGNVMQQGSLDAKSYALKTKREHPEATVLGYAIPADSLLPRARQPLKQARKGRREKSVWSPVALRLPGPPGLNGAVLLLGVLGGLGWLLGRRPALAA